MKLKRKLFFVCYCISLLRIDNNRLIQSVAKMLREEIRKARVLPWPPKANELEQVLLF